MSMVIWGVSWSSAKVMASYGDPLSIAYIRFLIVVISLLPIIISMKLDFQIPRRSIPHVLTAGFFLGCYSLAFFSGLKVGTAGAGGVIVTVLNPIMAFLIGTLVSRQMPSRKELIGLLIGVFGGAILLHLWDDWHYIINDGNYLFVLGAFLWALMSKVTSKAKAFGHPFVFNFWMHVFVIIFFRALVDFSALKQVLYTADGLFWWNMFYFGTVNSTIATGCYLYATSELGAERASSYVFIVPLGAVLSTWLFLDENIELDTVTGGLLGLLAVFVINKKQLRKKINN